MGNVEALAPVTALHAARAVYFTDLTSGQAKVIPLGVFAELVMPRIHGLALRARAQLTDEEVRSLSPLFHNRLTSPFNFLRDEFQAAWDEAEPGQALAFLARRHTAALSVVAPKAVKARRHIWRQEDPIEMQLYRAVDDEFAALLREYDDRPTPKGIVIEVSDERMAA